MATFDVSASTGAGKVAYQPASPYESRANQVNFATTPLQIADVVNVIPLSAYEFVAAANLRTESACTATATIAVSDSRTGGATMLAAVAPGAAGTTLACSAAGVNVVPAGAAGGGAGFLRFTIGTAAMLAGVVTLQTVVGKAF